VRSFSIDVYVWQAELKDWLWVPAHGSGAQWPAFPGVSQADLLSSVTALVFRIDNSLWLGNERDGFPLEVWVQALSGTLEIGSPHEVLGRLSVGDHLAFEIRQGADEDTILLSRWSTRPSSGDYLEETARQTGSYYRDFPVSRDLWGTAVTAALLGLRDALRASPASELGAEQKSISAFLMTDFDSSEKL
jgi:hypothetical protein